MVLGAIRNLVGFVEGRHDSQNGGQSVNRPCMVRASRIASPLHVLNNRICSFAVVIKTFSAHLKKSTTHGHLNR